MIEIKNCSYDIKGRPILRNISLTIGKGLTGIIGPNGAGKTTLLAHISRRIESRNTVFIDGRAVETFKSREYARKAAVMAQTISTMAGDLTAGYVVLMGRFPYLHGSRYSDSDRAIALSAMEKTGTLAFRDTPVRNLSGGERQRVYFARALAQETEILLLDEPMNHLDIKHKIKLMERLASFEGTAVMVLHDLSLAARYCRNVVVMKEGQVIAAGPAEKVMNTGAMEDLFEVPFYQSVHKERNFLYY